ncbi:MAG: 3-hydroxyacyl-CoA dehydrogenase NAD-binding domain-containing protein, partial [Candidatus Nanopelagicales bacterium]
IALITLDNGFDHKRPNTFGPSSLAALGRALDEVGSRTDLVAVCVTGKPFVFSVGADLKVFRELTSHDQVVAIGQLGHSVFRRLGELAVPSIAFINGAAMGGGLEVALNCTYRTAATDAKALALPEVFLGLIPGWGGAFLLPHIIGPRNAVQVIVENPLNSNTMMKPRDALGLGVVDALFEPADFVEESLRWVAKVLDGTIEISRPSRASAADWAAAMSAASAFVAAKTHSVPPAPLRAIELLTAAETADRDTAFAAEDQALADLTLTPELASSLYAFDLVQKRAKRPAGVPDKKLSRPVTKVGIVGAGLMASQLALLFARRLHVPVHLVDIDSDRVDQAITGILGEIDALTTKRRISPDESNRLRGLISASTDASAFSDADFVIEAVFEDLAVKQQVFVSLEGEVSDSCVLATNTSSLSVTEMSRDLQHPERVVGFHFFNPVAVMPLIEIARTPSTNDETLSTAFVVARLLGKSAVLVKDSPGFVVNRLLTRLIGEVTAAVDEGTSLHTADRALTPLGLPMSPFMLLQLVGPAVALHVAQTMHQAFPDRFKVSAKLEKLVAAEKPGVYEIVDGRPQVDPEVAAIFDGGTSPASADQILQRALTALAQECRLMVDDGVVAGPQDIDLCMLLGAGWPFWLGGVTPYLDRS